MTNETPPGRVIQLEPRTERPRRPTRIENANQALRTLSPEEYLAWCHIENAKHLIALIAKKYPELN